MTYQIDISREAVDGVAAFWWGKGYPKIGNLLWSLSAALDAAEAEKARAVAAERERCAVICEEQAQVFGSDEYATGQPMSSFKERFACECIAAAIRTGAKP